jgi:hypothetical protein
MLDDTGSGFLDCFEWVAGVSVAQAAIYFVANIGLFFARSGGYLGIFA